MIDKKIIFSLEESETHPGKYLIRMNHDKFFLSRTEGSFNIVCARLMGLTYANYLRFCRDVLGAELYGKNQLYVLPYFQKSAAINQFINLLNNKANMVLWEREHPDFEAHMSERN